jgi:hypothetical protein
MDQNALSSSFQRERAKQERLEGLAAVNHEANLLKDGAGDRDRTGTGLSAHGILSPRRLPIPPLRRDNRAVYS